MNYTFCKVITGGLDPQKSALLGINSVITDEKFNIIDQLQTYIKPNKDLTIDPEALKINGLTEKDWANSPFEKEAIQRFNYYIWKNQAQNFVGYNITFSIDFLKSLCMRNLELLECDLIMDLQTMARSVQCKKYALKSARQFFGILESLNDIQAEIEIAKRILC